MRDGKLRPIGELADRLDRISARRADALTCPSDVLVETLRKYGAVSEQTVTQMAAGALTRSRARR